MNNIYLYDFLFAVVFMLNKGLGCRFRRRNVEWFPEFSGFFFWAEVTIIFLWSYLRPPHTDSEGMVSIGMMFTVVIIWSIIVIKKKFT